MTDQQVIAGAPRQEGMGGLEPAPWGIGSVALVTLIAAVLLILTQAAAVILAFALGYRRQSLGLETAILLGAALSDLVVLALTLGFARILRRFSLRGYGFRSFSVNEFWLPAVGLIAGWGIVIIYVAIVSALHLGRLKPTPNLPVNPSHLRSLTIPLVLTVVAVAPLVEESFFRGFVFRGLLGRTLMIRLPGRTVLLRLGFWAAAIISGLFFAALHGELGLLIPFTLVGALFAWMFWRAGSLWPNIIAHASFNALSLILGAVTQR